MTGAIPKYGENFRRESVAYIQGLSSTRYVLKGDSRWFIRSDSTRERWTIFVAGPAGAAFPLGDPFDTFTEAMRGLLVAFGAVSGPDAVKQEVSVR